MDWLQILLAILSGGAIGTILGLVGGGGSILAVPLLIYVVGVGSTHQAIGTAAVAVAVNALFGLATHARARTVKWRCAAVFAAAGALGAAGGAELGKAFDGGRLLFAFGLLMIAIGLLMLRKRSQTIQDDVRLTRDSAGHLLPRLIPAGLGTGVAAGFFGIGGGFLIVPALIAATAMPVGIAVGTSLAVIAALGLTTAASYALSGYVDWSIVALLLAGGLGGAAFGTWLGGKLAGRTGMLEKLFAAMVLAVGLFIIVESWISDPILPA